VASLAQAVSPRTARRRTPQHNTLGKEVSDDRFMMCGYEEIDQSMPKRISLEFGIFSDTRERSNPARKMLHCSNEPLRDERCASGARKKNEVKMMKYEMAIPHPLDPLNPSEIRFL
jgi:hypothetical protein